MPCSFYFSQSDERRVVCYGLTDQLRTLRFSLRPNDRRLLLLFCPFYIELGSFSLYNEEKEKERKSIEMLFQKKKGEKKTVFKGKKERKKMLLAHTRTSCCATCFDSTAWV